MTTMATTVAAIRRILHDEPVKIQLGAAVSSSSATGYTTVAADIGKVGLGNILEHDDGTTGAEQVRVTATDPAALTFTVERGYGNSTATTHSSSTYLLKDPRFLYDTVAQAVNTALDTDLFNDGVVDLNEHQVTSSATTFAYDAPSSSCEEFLAVAQMTATMTEPAWLYSGDFTRLPRNIDTSLYATGKVFLINRNYGVGGTDLYYVTCAHKHTITSLTARAERIVQWLACAYLLDWTEPRRTAGPTNQGDRTVRPGQGIATSAYYRELARSAIADERSDMRKLSPPQKIFRRA